MSSEKKENRICQSCQKDFTIEPDDFGFYEKMKVPAPTFCPECRLVRRLNFRNERTFYKRQCDLCKEDILSMYEKNTPFPVYCHNCWWGDNWDPMIFGVSYDFKQNFFEQFQSLLKNVPLINLFFGGKQLNSEYCNYVSNDKNCYLCFGGMRNEQLFFSKNVAFSKDSADIYSGDKLELCYENIECENSYQLIFSKQCENCTSSAFLYDCRNCQNCFGCANLRNKNYCIWNKQYTREEYFKKIQEFNIEDFQNLENLKLQFFDFYKKSIHKFAHLVNVKNSSGDNLLNTRNCQNCFDIFGTGSDNCKYTHYVVLGVKDSYDNYGMPQAEKVYETIAIGFDSNENSDYYFSYFIRGSSNIYYSRDCNSCHDLFGCIGLHNKSYCILNKQYTKEQYEELVPKIIKQMNDLPYIDDIGNSYAYGEFFPAELSPFCYNETIAQEYFPLTKIEAEKQGYKWKEREKRNYEIDIKTKDIPDNIKEVNEEIIGKVIECEHSGKCNEQCTEAFKIIESELQFYQRMNLPLPHLCPNCRHYQRLKQRNPLKLWTRTCMCDKENHLHGKEKCEVEFETSYAPDRPEIIYCEKCYQQEVY